MNKLFKRAVSFAAIAVMVFAFNIVAMAQGTTTINVSKSSASVGDSITVSITATESGTITVKYTASMLSLSSCSVSGYTSEGNAVSFSGKQGDIVFSAAAEGTASIIVSSSANSGSSTTLTIGGSSSSSSTSTASESTTEETTTTEETVEENTETTEETTEEAPATTTAASGVGTLNADGGFDIDGVSYVVSERFSDSDMPAGFSKTTVTIGSSTYSEPTNGSLTLLYLKPADNTSGSGVFYLYNAEAGTVSPFLMLGTADSYVIVSDNGSAPTSAFTATTLDVNGGTATAYTIDGAEFFYVYGTNQDGASGWFVYDSTYKTVSRVDESALSASSTTDTTEEVVETETSTDNNLYVEKLNLYRKIIMGLIVLCVVLLFIIINKAIRGHGDDDDFNGDVFAKAPTKSSRRLPRSIVFGGKDRGEDDGDDDEEDDEYDDDEEYYDDDDEEYDDFDEDDEEDDRDFSKSRFESESYEARRASSLNMMDLNDL
ncbi:hypothetical protein SAMN02910377_01916 [Pseudobutyrivibrio ruminis]|uniref:Cohesin domain-containing protein n=1 Tax=Pseudobutyrivibrio ruminis TaxID=46206 RepID=A0A1H7K3W1_9FIRM|nr:hypothetical protein [Pseudobutyrivibrio ruminis]SEK81601.1 hypothetical protein SAMN02910377_01916 [Pseudobutyrivibrio ruminis]